MSNLMLKQMRDHFLHHSVVTFIVTSVSPVLRMWVSCHHAPHVMDRGDSVQILGVTTKIINKQLLKADKRWG
jgi:hypothetical protein